MTSNNIVSNFFSFTDKSDSFEFEIDDEGVNFYISEKLFTTIGEGKGSNLAELQFTTLRMLCEQGQAEEIPNGFIVPANVVVQLDNHSCEILNLPKKWNGSLKADIQGQSANKSSFAVNLYTSITTSNKLTRTYKVNGGIIKFSEKHKYLLTPAQFHVFQAQEVHNKSDKNEYDNLAYIYALQQSQEEGSNLSLGHFEKLRINCPKSVSIEAEIDTDGNLHLTPYMGQEASHEKIEKVLGQLKSDNTFALRVGEEIVLFDEKKLKAVKEVIKNRTIPKKQVQDFLKNPTAYIDASLVNLDVGFSARVKGVTVFKHGYFGETDSSGIDWFGKTSPTTAAIQPIGKIIEKCNDKETMEICVRILEDVLQTGASEIEFEGQTYDTSNKQAVITAVSKLKKKTQNEFNDDEGNGVDSEAEGGDGSGEGAAEGQPPNADETYTVDVELNDEDLGANSPTLERQIDEVLWKGELDWSNHARSPYPHQKIGVQWILGLINSDQRGGLLADDMGLGKTYMALSAVDHLYRQLENEQFNDEEIIKKPVLIVAPLSLLENWKDEVKKTFNSSPFKDIVILQSEGELRTYKSGGVETKQQSNENDAESSVKYSLKIGKSYGTNRLDMPSRLIITTYHTLRDYQFSLCSIDWSIVVFDEAQNIKNPNALQTRAAKGIKSDFNIVATGTPVENSLADFWCLLDTASPGFLGTYQDFRSQYITPITQAAGDEVDEIRGRIGRELRIKVGATMLRRLKEDHLEGLPEKRVFVGIQNDAHWQYMSSLERVMQNRQCEVYGATLENANESDDVHTLTTLRRLRESSLHPNLVNGGQLNIPKKRKDLKAIMSESAKMQSLVDVLDDIKRRKEKCIIFTENKRLQTFLSLSLKKNYGLGLISIINGDAKAVAKKDSTPTRKTMISDFEAKKGFNIIIMSPVAAGVGLTVVGANNVIHFERHWNPAKEAQATDRVYRIGQKKDVNVYVPLLHHPEFESFDVNLHKLLSKKTLLKDAVVTPEQVVPEPDGLKGKSTFEANSIITGSSLVKLSWQEFEALTVELLSREFKTDNNWLTNNGPDHGADGILESSENAFLIQAKHTEGAKFDGYSAIQEVYSAKPIYEKMRDRIFNKLIFVTNATVLSKKSREIARDYEVDVFSGKEIATLLAKYEISYWQVLARLDKPRMKI